MARLTPNGYVGMVGNVVSYTMNGQQYLRTKPTHTKKRKKNPVNMLFGEVTRNGSPMARLIKLYGDLLFHFSLGSYNNMRGWIRNLRAANPVEWDLAVRPNHTGNLNPACDFRDFISVPVSVGNANGIITVSIPEFNPAMDIKSPAGTRKINMKVIAVTSPYKDTRETGYAMQSFSFDNKDTIVPSKECRLITEGNTGKPGHVAMIIIALEFMTTGNNIIRDPKWLPAAGIAMGRLS